MSSTLQLIVNFIQVLFSKNQTVEEIIPVLEEAGAAFASARVGTAFSVAFPETFGGVAGTTTLAWSPTPK